MIGDVRRKGPKPEARLVGVDLFGCDLIVVKFLELGEYGGE